MDLINGRATGYPPLLVVLSVPVFAGSVLLVSLFIYRVTWTRRNAAELDGMCVLHDPAELLLTTHCSVSEGTLPR
jgi:hypothetical protein